MENNKEYGTHVTQIITEGETIPDGHISYYKIKVKAESQDDAYACELSMTVVAHSRYEAVSQNEKQVKNMSDVAIESVRELIMRNRGN